jgi:hypothetical protein
MVLELSLGVWSDRAFAGGSAWCGRGGSAWGKRTGLDAVLQAVQLPAGIAHLDTGLADVDGDDLTHGWRVEESGRR